MPHPHESITPVNHRNDTLPTDGLKHQTRILIERIPSETLAAYWGSTSFYTHRGNKKPFKSMHTREGKLVFISCYIHQKMVDSIKQSNTKIGANGLVKFQGWVINRVLRQMNVNPANLMRMAYNVPNNLKQLGLDLCFYQVARKKPSCGDNGIYAYASLEAFAEHIEVLRGRVEPKRKGQPYMPKRDQREAAFTG